MSHSGAIPLGEPAKLADDLYVRLEWLYSRAFAPVRAGPSGVTWVWPVNISAPPRPMARAIVHANVNEEKLFWALAELERERPAHVQPNCSKVLRRQFRNEHAWYLNEIPYRVLRVSQK